MKKLLLLAAVFTWGKLTTAQQKATPGATTKDTAVSARDTAMKNYISMQGGQMIIVKDDKAGRMAKDMTMTDGTLVKVNGQVKTRDGHSFQLKEGDRVYMNGRIEGPSKSPM